jgi:hypothetical protein
MFDVGLPMALGRAPASVARRAEPRTAFGSPAVLLLLLLALGLVMPAPVHGLLDAAARTIGGG